MSTPLISQKLAAPGLVLGCVVFGLGSVIVKFVPVGGYAIAFWRLAIAAVVFWLLMRFFGQRLPQSSRARRFALSITKSNDLPDERLALDMALFIAAPGLCPTIWTSATSPTSIDNMASTIEWWPHSASFSESKASISSLFIATL